MTQASARLSLRTAAPTLSGTMNTLLRAGLGGALLALTACSGDIVGGSDGVDGELEDQGSELDVFDRANGPEGTDAIEKATFDDDLTLDGFNVACSDTQKALIREADARAREILAIVMPATADARVNRTTQKAGIFRTSFVPNASTNPDPNRTSPDEWDIAAFQVAQKLVKVLQVLASAVHTCHGGDESVLRKDGTFLTCDESMASAATSFAGGDENPVRWCEAGLEQDVGARAVTLLHELTHQDRTADATGGRVIDDNSTGRLYNAHNYGRWCNNNQPE